MDSKTASDQLNRILSFFPRVDSKASALLAINSTMIGVLAARAKAEHFNYWYIVACGALAIAALSYSLIQLYLCAYPKTKGGSGSHVFFGSIAARTESDYIDSFKVLNDDQWLRDLSGQVWRNSEILCEKYLALKHSFVSTIVALVPWAIAIAFTSIRG